MKILIILLSLLNVSLFAANAPSGVHKEQLILAFTIISGDFPPKMTLTYHEAVKLAASYLESPDAKKIVMPEAALKWVPQSGPCDPAILEMAFLASVARDHLLGMSDGRIHRAWLAAIRLYRLLRSEPQNDFPIIPAIEEMIAKELKGDLAADGTAIEVAEKRPNKTPEPTPVSVTPRAIEGVPK